MRRRPAPNLIDLQAGMQAAILSGNARPILPLMRSGAEADRETLAGVYTAAYALRLVGVLKADFPYTAAYLGDAAFDRAARSYILAHPSPHRSARWVGDRFASHLASMDEFAGHSQASELAALEWALGLAFDAPDAPALSLGDLASVPPEAWGGLIFTPHPSAAVFTETCNAFDIWSALKDETPPPQPHRHAEALTYLVCRREGTAVIRRQSPEEAMLWREAAQGASFGRLGELAAIFGEPSTAASRVAGCVQAWLESEALAAPVS